MNFINLMFEKERIINRVLINNETSLSVAIDEGLPSLGMLINWIKQYKENCYNIVERKRGRPTMNNVKKNYEKMFYRNSCFAFRPFS